jgi:maleamate amidohydrolase
VSDLDIYSKQNFGNRIGFGERPALLIVDFTVGFNDPEQFGGGNIDAAVHRTVGLLAFARRAGLPVAHTRIVYAEDGSDAGVFAMKAPNLKTLTEHAPGAQIVPELTPDTGELVVRKTQASAFFGTGVAAWLIQHRVDTLVVAGCTTSGCVRASVIDACSHNFRPVVARDCVGDRAIGPHEANLFDMSQKYADVIDRDEIIDGLSSRLGLRK